MKTPGIAGSAISAVILASVWILHTPGPLLGPARDSQVRQSSGGAEDKRSAAVKLPQNGPWLASRRHFAGINQLPECQDSGANADAEAPPERSSAAKTSTDAVARRAQLWCIPGNEQVRAMVAIVADPVHTHMSLQFDRSVEAINLAAESANYVMDRYWLPWSPVTSSTDSTEGSGKGEPRDESQPGLLLFRWNGPASQSGEVKESQSNPHGATLLYVFLVSDTATDGINGEQFSHAVDYIEDVCAPQRATCGGMDAVRIMGPTFSGSLYSLRRLVESRPSQHFVAYSGTVSSVCAQLNQGLLASQQPGNQDSDPYGPNTECNGRNTDYKVANLQFHSMVNDTETAIHRFVDMLQEDKHISCDGAAQVAILSEAATAYGSAPRAANTNAKNTNERKRPCYTNFSYPREISNLRNAYQSLIKRQSTPEGGNPNASQSSLPFNFTDLQPNKSDEPPDFSSSQGPLSKEAVLMDFAADIRRQHYKYIGIIGSNVLDVMFLATFLRTACPDIRLFVINADLLFERDSDNAPYIGTLALTTYPMVGRNLVWSRSPGERLPRLPFADQYEESMFNATFLLIREIAPQQNSAKPYEMSAPFVKTNSNSGTSSNSATSNNPGTGSNPDTLPLWLTVVGTGGFWPVQVILPPDRQKTGSVEQETDSAQMRRSDFSGAWKAVILTLSAVAFLQMIVLLSANPLSSSLHDFAARGPVCSQRVFFINVASSNLALCLALAAAPAWRFANLKRDLEAILISFVAAVAIVALFVTCVRLIRICRRQKESTRPASLKVHGLDALYMTIWILAVLGFYLWDRLLADDPSHYGFFFGYRATHLATGVSPLTPMLPLGLCMYLWSIFEIFRLRFNEAMRPRLNAAPGFPGAMTESLIASSVKDYFLHRNYMMAFLVFFGVWLLTLHPLHPFQLFEHPEFAYLYEIWFALVLSLMLASGLRLGQIWAQVRRLLRELERSPVRHSFSRLKGEGWSPIWQSGGQEDEWTNMSRSFEVLKQVRVCSKSLDPELEKSIEQAETAREQIHELFFLMTGQKTPEATTLPRNEIPPSGNEVMRGMQAKFTEIQGLLAKVLNHTMRVLEPYWVTHPSDGDEPAAEEKHGSGKTADAHADKKNDKNANKKEDGEDTRTEQLLERFVAFRYVAFIRAVLSHVRLLLIFLAISFSLMLISLNVYSFEPHQSLIWSFTAIFGVIGVTAIGVLMEAHRNEILSIITGTTPNELGIGFYVRIASLGAAPLITLMATHFPSIGRFLLSFFQPGLDALK